MKQEAENGTPPAGGVPACECTLGSGPDGGLRLRVAGRWLRQAERPPVDAVCAAFDGPDGAPQTLSFDTRELEAWDSSFLTFLLRLESRCAKRGVRISGRGLPDGVRQLLRMVDSSPRRTESSPDVCLSFTARVGAVVLHGCEASVEVLAFIGEATVAFVKMLGGRARIRGGDLLRVMAEAGPQAVPIITLIAFLMGLILAFVGAMQLRMFGAQIYVANLVGIGIVRQMGALMTGVVMAGRTGAAFAAELGTMQVNEEIDALETLGLPPMEFLVLPRLLGLALVMPLLCLYADLMGIVGGMVVGAGVLDLGVIEYYNQTVRAVHIHDLLVGLVMSAVFGVLVALCGCLRGLRAGRNSAAVGHAATGAMVSSIVAIVIATAVITVICNVLHV